jgi:hypothetical protein
VTVKFVDLIVQLRRRWIVVLGGTLLGFIVGIALDQAFVPRGAGQVERPVIVLVDTVIGVVAGFAAAVILAGLTPRLTTVDDVRRTVGLPVIAQLPSATVDADDFTAQSPSRRMRTSLREGVLNLRALAGGELPERIVIARTDAVTEASGVDGGLARALVESGYVPALIQSDFESRILVRPATVDHSSLGEATRQDPGGYHLVAVTDSVAAAGPRERSALIDTYLHDLGERYDVSIAQVASDSAPLQLRSIAPVAKAVLLVVRSNRTTVESLLSLYAELVSLEVKPLGVIMTSVAPRHRVLLRESWSPTDFRSGDTVKRASEVKLAGFSIAELAQGSSWDQA